MMALRRNAPNPSMAKRTPNRLGAARLHVSCHWIGINGRLWIPSLIMVSRTYVAASTHRRGDAPGCVFAPRRPAQRGGQKSVVVPTGEGSLPAHRPSGPAGNSVNDHGATSARGASPFRPSPSAAGATRSALPIGTTVRMTEKDDTLVPLRSSRTLSRYP